MIELRFPVCGQDHSFILKGREGFRALGPLLVQWPEDKVVARYVKDRWHMDEQQAAGFECNHYAHLRFMDDSGGASQILGPFDRLSFSNGRLYADQILVAELVAHAERWIHCDTGLRWHAILISPATPDP